jgi:hypothetical protein
MDNEIIEAEEQEKDQVGNISFTELSRQMFQEEIHLPWYQSSMRDEVDEGLDSIYEIASAHHKPVLEFVQQDPEYAVMCVEMSYAKWTNVLTQAGLTGCITTDDGNVSITKNQIKAIELRIKQARYELDYVTDLAMTFASGTKKRDHLLRTLYMNAVMHRDTKALIYLIDRVDGRPAESKVAELSYDNAYNIYMILHTLFDRQLSVLNAGSGTILVCCSRRAGKTHMLVSAAIIECLRKPNTTCIYIGETMELTEGLVDDVMNKLIDACHLQDKRGKRFNWRKMDNGSKLLVRGLSNTKDPDQIRGKGAKIIIIDEFFHLKSDLLEYLQREVLQPMQMDYADDYKFICAGTPPQVKNTYGEVAWKTWEVPHFTWTWRDNPHPASLAAREAYVEKAIEEKGLSWDTPFVRREYNGEWAYDDDLILYPNVKVYDPKEAIPQWKISRVFFGVDYGCSDNDAVWGVVWSDDEGKGYQFFECKFNRLDIVDYKISQLEYLKDQVKQAWIMALGFFGPIDTVEQAKQANKRILWDADDNDQHVTQELGLNVKLDGIFETLSLQIANAHKTDKKIMWDKIDELMRTGKLLLIKDSKTVKECESTILLRGPNGEIYSEIDDKVFHPDLLPCMRYALFNVLGV